MTNKQLFIKELIKIIEEKSIRFLNYHFTDLRGKDLHLTVPAYLYDQSVIIPNDLLNSAENVILQPDKMTVYVNPLYEEPTLLVTCDIINAQTMQDYGYDSRLLAGRTEDYIESIGIADQILVSVKLDFFIFEHACWNNSDNYYFHNRECSIQSSKDNYIRNRKVISALDYLHDIRSTICLVLEQLGQKVCFHFQKNIDQCQIGTTLNKLVYQADAVQLTKYVVRNVVESFGKTAIFMPRPLNITSNNGMPISITLVKGEKNIFGDNNKLSETAIFFIGGILQHMQAITAFTNASTNSYRRLLADQNVLTIKIFKANTQWIVELCFPDAITNPYLAFSAIIIAGLEGIQNQVYPNSLGVVQEQQFLSLPLEQYCYSLNVSLNALDKDRLFLTRHGIFSDEIINNYIQMKLDEINQIKLITHPAEIALYNNY